MNSNSFFHYGTSRMIGTGSSLAYAQKLIARGCLTCSQLTYQRLDYRVSPEQWPTFEPHAPQLPLPS